MKRALKRALVYVSIPLVRLWLWTLRVRIVVAPELAERAEDGTPWVLSFFHGSQFALLRWPRRRPTAVLVSHSDDGTLQAMFLGALGFRIVRGSTSRGGATGLRALVRFARGGGDLAFAVDGPRGPRGEVQGGVLAASRLGGGLIVPMGSAASRKTILSRAWDKFEIPWPFARVCVVLGAPCKAASETLKASILQANARAADGLRGPFQATSEKRSAERASLE